MTISAPQKNTETEVPKIRQRPHLTAALPYLVWLAGALLLVEMVLGMSGLGEEEIFKLDKNLGTMHMTNKSVTWRKEGYARSYFDHDGMREHGLKIAKPPSTYRIALLGDSLVEGLQVPIEQTYGKILEKDLARRLHRPVEVLNFGTSGYSTVQEYLQLDEKVFKYSPDMVLVGYNARDMFENWSPPDQTLANVRPFALKLPNKALVVDNSSVTTWMRSPRAKILNSISWIREKSRIWGLISAAETEASFHSEFYKVLMDMLTQPGKTMKSLARKATKPENWQALAKSSADQMLKFIAPTGQTPVIAEKAVSDNSVKAQTKPQEKEQAGAAMPATEAKPRTAGEENYLKLMSNTQEALYQAMDKKCREHNSKFMVLALPSRAALSPIAGMGEPLFGTNYEDEVRMIETMCAKNHIAFIDGLTPAMKLTSDEHSKMFYTAHMTALGHEYLASLMERTLAQTIK